MAHARNEAPRERDCGMSPCLPLSHIALPDPARADHVVARDRGGNHTHARFVQRVGAWQETFSLHPGNSIALYFENTFDYMCALFGAWHAGKKTVLLADRQPSTLKTVLPQVDACTGDLPGAIACVEPASCSAPLQPLNLADTELAIFTSGSTGQPEQIIKRLRQLDSEVQALHATFGQGPGHAADAEVFASVSHQHIYGLLFHILWPLAARRPIYGERLVYPEDLLARLAGAKNAVLISSPALLSRLPEHLEWSALQPGLRAIFSGGGPLSPEASAHCHALTGISPTEVFGSSETGGIAWRQACKGDTWSVFSGVQWRVADGLLQVKSSYLREPEEWYATSDRVTVEHLPRGMTGFTLQGRSDRIVKIAEKRISLTQLEAVLQSCPEVAAARALTLVESPGQPAPRIAAVIELTEAGWSRLFQQGRRALSAALREALRPHVEAVAIPRRWRYVEALPVNEQGKVTQQKLHALFRSWLPDHAWQYRNLLEARARLLIPPDLRVFEGHFPQAPLVPGVAQLYWVHVLSRECFQIPDTFLRLDVLKFKLPMLPGQPAELELKWNPEKGFLSFVFSSDAGTHSSGRLVYATEP